MAGETCVIFHGASMGEDQPGCDFLPSSTTLVTLVNIPGHSFLICDQGSEYLFKVIRRLELESASPTAKEENR